MFAEILINFRDPKIILFVWLIGTAILGFIPFFWRFPFFLPFYIIADFFDAIFHFAFHYAIWDIFRFILSLIFWPSIIVGKIICLFLDASRRPQGGGMRRRDRR